jgi:U-box domain.
VVASDGNSYERNAISGLIRSAPARRKSPLTGESLQTQIFPNLALRKRIEEHESELLDAAETSRAALSFDEPPAKRACL